ncbi:Hypothetical protein FKW44_003163 [Caligus rogercresseyi]|uniref:Uncharacterized protein n=1 Tax=Caligus rogercresseyi TaxID=217165 RepID=A0A7T8KL71_CALRO|nr:Hypothetical protein FKW44_003163 [Caligus rogercresseyi]
MIPEEEKQSPSKTLERRESIDMPVLDESTNDGAPARRMLFPSYRTTWSFQMKTVARAPLNSSRGPARRRSSSSKGHQYQGLGL